MVHNRRTRVRRKKRCNSTIKKGGEREKLYVEKYEVFKLSNKDTQCKKQFEDPIGHRVNVFVFVKKDDGKWKTDVIFTEKNSDRTARSSTYDTINEGNYDYGVAMRVKYIPP